MARSSHLQNKEESNLCILMLSMIDGKLVEGKEHNIDFCNSEFMHNGSDSNVAVDKEILYYPIQSHQPQILLCEQTDLHNKTTLLSLCICAWTEEHLDPY
jgi:uncharacterized protein (UPF0371 family)